MLSDKVVIVPKLIDGTSVEKKSKSDKTKASEGTVYYAGDF